MKIQVELMNMKNKITILLLAMTCSLASMAQVGIGTTSPNSNAALEISSTSQGILFPRMTTAQRDAISSPAKGLTIFNTDVNVIQTNTGTSASPSWKNWQAPLVLNLDAGNSASYAGSGTAWTDLSGFGNNGTLVNGPTYSSADGGSIVFDGVNDFAITTQASSPTLNLTSQITLETWIMSTALASSLHADGINSKGFSSDNNSGVYETLLVPFNSVNYPLFRLRIGSSTPVYNPTNIPINLNQIYQFTSTYDGSTMRIYINGIESGPGLAQTGNIEANAQQLTTGVRFCLRGGGADSFFSGRIYINKIYNRALSASEILQNFNDTKSRYGL